MMKSKIGQLLKESPLKREFIMKELDISANTLSNWATGKAIPSLQKAFKLSRLLGVTIEDLYEWKNDDM